MSLNLLTKYCIKRILFGETENLKHNKRKNIKCKSKLKEIKTANNTVSVYLSPANKVEEINKTNSQ
jgi:methyl coenzyme M reductase subunit D